MLLGAALAGATIERPDIDGLIQQLGSDSFTARETAEASLIRLGLPAVEALRRAEHHGTAEVRHRARRALHAITRPTDKQRSALRREAQAAFMEGAFDRMFVGYDHLASLEGANYHDLLWKGHAADLTQRWDQAVDAYAHAIVLIDRMQEIENQRQREAHREMLARLAQAPGRKNDAAAQKKRAAMLDMNMKRRHAYHVHRRGTVHHLIGRIQRDHLHDPHAAVATFQDGLDGFEAAHLPLKQLLVTPARDRARAPLPHRFERGPLNLLREVAITTAHRDGVAASLPAWQRYTRASHWHGMDFEIPLPIMRDLLATADTVAATETLPLVIPLRADGPAVRLEPAHPAVLAAAYRSAASNGRDARRYALHAVRQQVVVTVHLTADIEHLGGADSAQVICRVPLGAHRARPEPVGSITWPVGTECGRRRVDTVLALPRPSPTIDLELVQVPGRSVIHGVTLEPVLKQAERHDGPRSRVSVEAVPPGGVLHHNDRPVTGMSVADLAAGPHRFTYSAVSSRPPHTVTVGLLEDRHHTLFLNPSSPFQWVATDLPPMGFTRARHADAVRLPGGPWLLAYSDVASHRLMTARSTDGVRWSTPEPAPWIRHCHTRSPALYVDRSGTVWMAYISNLLNNEPEHASGFRLWLTHTRDGRDWARPRPMTKNTASGEHVEPALFVDTPDGEVLLIWRDFSSRAATPNALVPLKSMQIQRHHKVRVRSPYVCVDDAERYHMVFLERNRRLRYCTSPDGSAWSAPVEVKGVGEEEGIQAPHLFLQGDSAALLYETPLGGWLRRGSVTETLAVGSPIQIAGATAPLARARVRQHDTEQVTVLAGGGVPWLMRTSASDLIAPRNATAD